MRRSDGGVARARPRGETGAPAKERGPGRGVARARSRPKTAPLRRAGPALLLRLYRALIARFGPRHWWPARTPFEVCVGAILTQNAAWTNVEKAIANLLAAGVLAPRPMAGLTHPDLARMIRPSGYFNVKARRLSEFLRRLDEDFGLDLDRLLSLPADRLRRWLLSVVGIGRETADSIVLYAAGQPTFVIDAYTRRVFGRHGIVDPDWDYDHLRRFFEDRLDPDAALLNDYHAQVVTVAKDFCRKLPLCEACPLAFDLAAVGGRPRAATSPVRTRAAPT